MKVVTPEISWHEREPIYSIDFQPGRWPIQRLASGGVDKIVRIWQMTTDAEGKGDFEFLSNLRRHTATVNVVRFSKNGSLLASAGDDQAILLWKLSDVPTPANNIFADEEGVEDKETWICHKTLRGHLGDVADLSWSHDNRYLVSGSVDNCAIIWDVVKGTKLAIFNEHKSYVQGVAFDPLGNYVATLSADRSLRIYNTSSKLCVHNVSKLSVPTPTSAGTGSQPNTTQAEGKAKAFRIFHDDSLRSFFRRLEFSPDGQLLFTPAGCMEVAEKFISASFMFARGAFSKPAVYLPSGEKSSFVVRVNPLLFQLRSVEKVEESQKDGQPEWERKKSLFCLPYRMVFAVATEDSVLIYDTQQTLPVGLLKNIHYHQISDLSWSRNGRALIVSSTDGFCTVATFEENELGLPYTAGEDGDADLPTKMEQVPQEVKEVKTVEVDTSSTTAKLPLSKSPNEKNPGSSKDLGRDKTTNSKEILPQDVDMRESKLDKSEEKTDTNRKHDAVDDTISSIKNMEVGGSTSPGHKTTEEKVEPKQSQVSVKPEEPKKKRIQFTTLSLNSK
ncbi:chromatin assembly factor 1 subunit B [Elysia marginata]|uniref:Chromatin assembly factor 1 subunit B n=1 Tax=Elysia marginata TaxID=1093978 RepID=A0AAV4F895_9GAST|nr:chromatin assembly factor 1 subunit B [Elysia marginata]